MNSLFSFYFFVMVIIFVYKKTFYLEFHAVLYVSGTPCVCEFSHDESYYRAEVISIHHSSGSGHVPLAGIRFVDYGSFEYVPTDK